MNPEKKNWERVAQRLRAATPSMARSMVGAAPSTSASDCKDGGQTFVHSDRLGAPAFYRVAPDARCWQCQPARHRKAGVVLQRLRQRLEHRRVAIGCFDKELRLPRAQGQRFELANALIAGIRILRQIADEGEVLAI